MKVFIGFVCCLAAFVSAAPTPDGDQVHTHLLTPIAQPSFLPFSAPAQVFSAHGPVLAPARAQVFTAHAPVLAPARAQVFTQAATPVFATAPVLAPVRSGPFISAQPAPVFSSKPFVFFGNRFVTPEVKTVAAPVPETTLAPVVETTAAPAPETTLAPEPETTLAPAPETTLAPAPETTAAPLLVNPIASPQPVYSVAIPAPVVVAQTRLEEAVPATYAYTYGVRDDLNSVNFGQNESRDGFLASGQYFVNLPDGRLQTVTYRADGNGYVADVSYSGTAIYADPKPTYN